MNIYQDIFDIIHNYVFGGATLAPNQDLVCTFVATFACIFAISVPFVMVWKIIKILMR